MIEERRLRLMIKNTEGKRLLKKTLLDYSSDIVTGIKENPIIINELLEQLEVTEEQFFYYISDETPANITFYDQALVLVRKKTLTK